MHLRSVLLWPRGMVSREPLPGQYTFPERSLLSPSWTYSCPMECWPRESLKGRGPESKSSTKKSENWEEIKAGNNMLNSNHLWSWMIISNRAMPPSVFCSLSKWWWKVKWLRTQGQKGAHITWYSMSSNCLLCHSMGPNLTTQDRGYFHLQKQCCLYFVMELSYVFENELN